MGLQYFVFHVEKDFLNFLVEPTIMEQQPGSMNWEEVQLPQVSIVEHIKRLQADDDDPYLWSEWLIDLLQEEAHSEWILNFAMRELQANLELLTPHLPKDIVQRFEGGTSVSRAAPVGVDLAWETVLDGQTILFSPAEIKQIGPVARTYLPGSPIENSLELSWDPLLDYLETVNTGYIWFYGPY